MNLIRKFIVFSLSILYILCTTLSSMAITEFTMEGVVYYDKIDGVKYNSVTLKDTTSGTTNQVRVKNMADGVDIHDAVTVNQLNDVKSNIDLNTKNIELLSLSDVMKSTITIDKVKVYDSYETEIKNKQDKATTLKGYGITDTYTKSEVDEKIKDISQQIDNSHENNVQNKINLMSDSIGNVQNQINIMSDEIVNVQNQMISMSDEIKEVGALSAALAGIHYVEPSGEEGDKFTGAISYGGYRGSSAEALGIAYKPNPNIMISASTSISNDNSSNNSYNIGFSMKFGKGNTATKTEIKNQINYINDRIEKLNERINNQEIFIKQLLEKLNKLFLRNNLFEN